MPLRSSVVAPLIVAAFANDISNSTAAAPNDKLAAVDKALELITSLRDQVAEEGEKEVQAYNKFSCFCKDTTTDKLADIQRGGDEKSRLEGEAGTLANTRDTCDTNIQTIQARLNQLDTDIKTAQGTRRSTAKLYMKNSNDVKAALIGLAGAIESLKASKNPTPSLLEVKPLSDTIRTAVVLADALGFSDKHSAGLLSFVQNDPPANEVQMEDYKFHSDDVIGTLENLQKQFTTTKDDLDKAEVSSIAAFDSLMQEKTHEIKVKNRELEQNQKKRSETISEIEDTSAELSTVEATLRDDQAYTNELAKMCTDSAKTWDQRSQTRANELATLSEAIQVIDQQVKTQVSTNTIRFVQKATSVRVAQIVAASPGAMDAIEEAAEEADAAPAFVQKELKQFGRLRASKRHMPSDSRDAIAEVLKTSGSQLKSTLLTALASKIAADPFAKVKQLIQELIERLLQEASNEANQKGWCDKSIADAKQRREYAAEEVAELNSHLEKYEAEIGQLAEDISELEDEIAKLYDNRNTTSGVRANESADNSATVAEAQQGLNALELCIQTLDRFYKTQAKNEVNLTLLQGPADDAPQTGFSIGEAYTGAQDGAVGVLGMLDVMKSDFKRTISETNEAEAQAVRDFRDFLTATGSSLAEKTEAHKSKDDQHGILLGKESQAKTDLDTEQGLLESAINELKDLKPVCIDTGMSYNERVSKREDEIEALNKAMCIFSNFEKYGPDAATAAGC